MKKRVRIRKGWQGAGREGDVIGPDLHQLPITYTPVLWDGEVDPGLFKAAGLEPAPEEEPLPEKLQAYRNRPEWYLAPDDSDWKSPKQKEQGYRETMRRYNAWPELERLADDARPYEGYFVGEFTRRLCKILESGKP